MVSGFLRFFGIINAALWFGSALFFAAFILPAVFSSDMRAVFGANAYQYYSGAVAMVLFRKFFVLEYFCGTLALVHLFGEKVYSGRATPRPAVILVISLFGFALLGGLVLEPHMENLRHAMYSAPTQELKNSARYSFGVWHAISQIANLIILGGLLAHLIRVTRSTSSARPGTFYQIP